MEKGADISECGKYRYLLWRVWDESKPMITFIGLNPSTADDVIDDRTITRCMNFAKSWGGGGLYMGNLFAFRATKPQEMFSQTEPIGERNDEVLKSLISKSKFIIACWGNGGVHLNRSDDVIKIFEENVFYLERNQSGQPKHPLYISADCEPKPYN